MATTVTIDGPQAARGLRELIAAEAADSERLRTLNQRTVDGLWSSGLMVWANPLEAGGSEPSFPEMIETWIELAWQDGSAGLDRHRQPAVGGGLRRLPPRRRLR